MDRILAALLEIKFKYADRDPSAVRALTGKIADAARRGAFVTYGDLVRGVTFQIPGVKSGSPFQIQEFAPFEQSLIADFLGYINLEAYRESQVLLSSLVVRKEDQRPSPAYFNWFKPLITTDPDTFWVEEVRKVHEHYSK